MRLEVWLSLLVLLYVVVACVPALAQPETPEATVPPDDGNGSKNVEPTNPPVKGKICVISYLDENENAWRDETEPQMAGVMFVLEHEGGIVDSVETDEGSELMCFSDLPEGNYLLRSVPPQNYRTTNPSDLAITVSSSSQFNVVQGFARIEPIQNGPLPFSGVASMFRLSDGEAQNLYIMTNSGIQKADMADLEWELVSQHTPSNNMVFSPVESGTLLAGDGIDCFRDSQGSTMWRSNDSTQSWIELPHGADLKPAAFHTSDPNIAWAIGCAGAYKTTDGGNSWQLMSYDDWGLYTLTSIVAPQSMSNRLYATGNSEGGSGALFRSDDGGITWNTMIKGLEFWITDIALQPNDADNVWFTTPSAVYHSGNGGNTWISSATGLESVAVQNYVFEGRGLNSASVMSDGRCFIGTEAGVYFSSDGGDTWSQFHSTQIGDSPVDQLVAFDANWGPTMLVLSSERLILITP